MGVSHVHILRCARVEVKEVKDHGTRMVYRKYNRQKNRYHVKQKG